LHHHEVQIYRYGKSHLAKQLTIDHHLVQMQIPLEPIESKKTGVKFATEIMYRGSWRFKINNDARIEEM
jgi:hypothetical protein